MIPEILFELCSGQKCRLRTDRQLQRNIPASSKGGIKFIRGSDLDMYPKPFGEKKKNLTRSPVFL